MGYSHICPYYIPEDGRENIFFTKALREDEEGNASIFGKTWC